MKDLICALWGPKHCGWCVDKEDTWFDHLMRFDQLLGSSARPWWERAAMRWETFNTEKLKIWQLGQRWHFRHHKGRY